MQYWLLTQWMAVHSSMIVRDKVIAGVIGIVGATAVEVPQMFMDSLTDLDKRLSKDEIEIAIIHKQTEDNGVQLTKIEGKLDELIMMTITERR